MVPDCGNEFLCHYAATTPFFGANFSLQFLPNEAVVLGSPVKPLMLVKKTITGDPGQQALSCLLQWMYAGAEQKILHYVLYYRLSDQWKGLACVSVSAYAVCDLAVAGVDAVSFRVIPVLRTGLPSPEESWSQIDVEIHPD